MQKLLSILVLMAISANVVMMAPLFHLRQHRIQRNMRNINNFRKSRENFEVLEFSSAHAKSLKWEVGKEGREFRYQGKLYDLFQADTLGNIIRYFVKHDKKEQALIANFQSLFKRNQNQSQDQVGSNFLTFLTHLFPSISTINSPFQNTSWLNHREKQVHYSSVCLSVPPPPPRKS